MKDTVKERQILEAINKLFPNINISDLRSGNEDAATYVVYFIPPENKSFLNSQYFFNGKLDFLHFTTLSATRSIIAEKNIRLYNLNNLNDPREYTFSGKLLKFNFEHKDDAKDNFYLLSMCEIKLLSSPIKNEFNIWRLYGDNGKGVALELNFNDCHPKYWKHYHLSKVHYGATSRKTLEDLSEFLNKRENQHPNVIVDLGQIACFHKSNLFALENEVRLLFDNRDKRLVQTKFTDLNGEVISPIIQADPEKSSLLHKQVKYLKLSIFYNELSYASHENLIPVPKIERIIFGHYYTDNFNKTASELSALCEANLGYSPKMEQSRVTKYFYDNL